jgi:ABC-2 type transport system ATP-binding protein
VTLSRCLRIEDEFLAAIGADSRLGGLDIEIDLRMPQRPAIAGNGMGFDDDGFFFAHFKKSPTIDQSARRMIPIVAMGSMSVSNLPENAIEITDLKKIYRGGKRGDKAALDGVTLNVPRGSFFGLLGPNGAGKSTLINIMAGLTNKSSGSVRVWGHDIDEDDRAVKLSIGVVPQELNIDPFFSPIELLDVQAGLYGVPKNERRGAEILAALGLADKANAYARALSGGMRRRLLVAKALVHTPPVVVLDEPTAGVDVELRRQLWSYIRELNAQGTTVLLTTHYLEEAEELCDRIAIIDKGKLIACDSTRELLKRVDGKSVSIILEATLSEIPPALAEFSPELRSDGREITFRYRPSRTNLGVIIGAVQGLGLVITDLSTEEADLEDIFLQLTKGPKDGAT